MSNLNTSRRQYSILFKLNNIKFGSFPTCTDLAFTVVTDKPVAPDYLLKVCLVFAKVVAAKPAAA